MKEIGRKKKCSHTLEVCFYQNSTSLLCPHSSRSPWVLVPDDVLWTSDGLKVTALHFFKYILPTRLARFRKPRGQIPEISSLRQLFCLRSCVSAPPGECVKMQTPAPTLRWLVQDGLPEPGGDPLFREPTGSTLPALFLQIVWIGEGCPWEWGSSSSCDEELVLWSRQMWNPGSFTYQWYDLG